MTLTPFTLVGQSYSQLLNRLSIEPDIPGSTTFPNLDVAQQAIGEVLTRNRLGIQDWLANSNKLRYNLNETFDYNVGQGIPAGSLQLQEIKQVVNNFRGCKKKCDSKHNYFVIKKRIKRKPAV